MARTFDPLRLVGTAVATALVLGMVLVRPAAADAQSREPVSPQPGAAASPDHAQVSLQAGAGVGHLLHGDFDYYAPAVEGGVSIRLSPSVRIEATASLWGKTERAVETDVPILGPNGPIGTVGRMEVRTRETFTTGEVNLMRLVRLGRIRVFAGGGAGMLTIRRTSERAFSDCTGAAVCVDTTSTFTSVSPLVQGVGRVEIPLSERVEAYAAGRFLVNLRDVGGSGTRFTGGIVVGF